LFQLLVHAESNFVSSENVFFFQVAQIEFTFDNGGKSHHRKVMPTLMLERAKPKRRLAVVEA